MENSLVYFNEYKPKPQEIVSEQSDNGHNPSLGKLPFPIEALGSFKEPVLALQQECQAAIEICFASAFMVLNHAAQTLANVKIENRVSPLSCFFITVAESGERKTTCESATLQIVQAYQLKLEKIHKTALIRYKSKRSIYEEDRKKILSSKDETKEDRLCAIDLEEPIMPKHPVLVTSDPTMQGLMRLFEEGFPSILLTSSEGGQFLGGYAMKQDNQLNTLATLSMVWDGSSFNSVKKEGHLTCLRGRRVTLHLGVQPSVLESFLKGRFVKDQGFLSRCLLSVSQSLIHQRTTTLDIIPDTHSQFLLLSYARIMSLYEKVQIQDDSLVLKTLTVEPKGLKLLKAFYYYGHKRCELGLPFHDIRGFVSKSIDHTLRIAATLMMYDTPDKDIIEEAYIKSAIEIIRFYMSQQLNLYSQNDGTPNKEASNLLNWILKRYSQDQILNKGTLQQTVSPKYRSKTILEPLLATLEDHGYIIRIEHNKWRLATSSGVCRESPQQPFPIFTGKENKDDPIDCAPIAPLLGGKPIRIFNKQQAN